MRLIFELLDSFEMRGVWILTNPDIDSQKDVKSALNSKGGKCSVNLPKTNFLISAYFERFLNFLRFVSCKLLKMILHFRQPFQIKIKIFYFIPKTVHQKKIFSQGSCKSKSQHLLSISFTLLCHSSINCLEGWTMQNSFFDTKLFGNSPNDLQISRNTMW